VKLIVGLGNPGKRYRSTWHNVGFAVVDALCAREGCRLRRSLRFRARLARAVMGGADVLFVQPQTYMNNSGRAVAAIARYRRVPVTDLVVVMDDADLPLGRVRIRGRGGHGGHKGLGSVIEHVGSDVFARVRVGIGRGADTSSLYEHVLRPVRGAEREALDAMVARAADAVQHLLQHGLDAAMNAFNG